MWQCCPFEKILVPIRLTFVKLGGTFYTRAIGSRSGGEIWTQDLAIIYTVGEPLVLSKMTLLKRNEETLKRITSNPNWEKNKISRSSISFSARIEIFFLPPSFPPTDNQRRRFSSKIIFGVNVVQKFFEYAQRTFKGEVWLTHNLTVLDFKI